MMCPDLLPLQVKVICYAGGQFARNEAGKVDWQGGETFLRTIEQTTSFQELVASLGRISDRNTSGNSSNVRHQFRCIVQLLHLLKPHACMRMSWRCTSAVACKCDLR